MPLKYQLASAERSTGDSGMETTGEAAAGDDRVERGEGRRPLGELLVLFGLEDGGEGGGDGGGENGGEGGGAIAGGTAAATMDETACCSRVLVSASNISDFILVN